MSAATQVQLQQFKAWGYYGFPLDKAPSWQRKRTRQPAPIGEVRYVIGWMADQMSRMRWSVLIDGSEEWSLQLPDGSTVVAAAEDDSDADTSNSSASEKVLELIDWTPNVVRQVTTNLFVAGQLDFVALTQPSLDPEEEATEWHVISVVDPDRDKTIESAAHTITALWPHPADPSMPDAPLFGVLPILEEMDWLSRMSRYQMANRMRVNGVIGYADGFDSANGGNFREDFEAASQANMDDPTNASAVLIRGAVELVEPAGNGMKGMSWVIPDFPNDDRIDSKMTSAIQRLAYGLPIPPEILLGLQAQSRATAYQVEENSYRAHIEPPATLVAALAQEALEFILDREVEVLPDPTDLLARRHSTQDAKDALAAGAISYAYYREVLDIPETAAADEQDLALMERVKASTTVPVDPGNVAAQSPPAVASIGASPNVGAVAAAVGGPHAPPLSKDELSSLSNKLAEVDHTLMMELAGATVQAIDRAREKVGAKVRSFPGLRKAVGEDVPNNQVVTVLGLQTVNDSGVPVNDIIIDALTPLSAWWETRAKAAQATVETLLGVDAKLDLTAHEIALSTDLLIDLTAEQILDTFDSPEIDALSAKSRARILTALGGG